MQQINYPVKVQVIRSTEVLANRQLFPDSLKIVCVFILCHLIVNWEPVLI